MCPIKNFSIQIDTKLLIQKLIMMNCKNALLLFCFVLGAVALTAQDKLEFPNLDASPMDAAHYPRTSAFNNYMPDDQKKPTQIKVLYSRPNKKEREIFGKLVPYGEVWRLGANEGTQVRFYQAVEIGGKFVAPGTYTLLAEVHPHKWGIIISSETNRAGAANLDPEKIVARAGAKVTNVGDSREAFTIGFQKVDEQRCNMVFEWDRTRATLPISFNPVFLDGVNASPMDLAQYPTRSRFQNFLKEEEKAANKPKIRVVYSRPQKKGRNIFGELLKFGEPWRLGANETTLITFFEDVKIGGTDVKAGRYGIMATVNKDKWDFVIHKNTQSWGVYKHDAETNVATFSASVAATPSEVEALSIVFEKKDDKNVDMIVAWDNSMARLPIQMK